jgi:ATP-dependent DNA ligase
MIELKPQKALHLHEVQKVKKFRFGEYAVMEKYDGWYLYIDCIDGEWDVLRSRQGREVPSLADVSNGFSEVAPLQHDCRLIFEGTIGNLSFHELNGIFNRKFEQAIGVTLHLHDFVFLATPENEFELRYQYAESLLADLEDIPSCSVSLVPILGVVTTELEAQELFRQVTSSGGEGVILKELSAGYHFGKRNSTLLKIKEEITKDLEVVGLVEGEGKYLGTLGALQVRGKNGIVIEVSGMSDWERNVWWGNPSTIIGKVVEVVAMKELPNGSLREPRYKSIRFDKDIGDID